MQACLYQTPHLACGMLVLVSEVLKIRPKLLETRSFDATAQDAPSTNGIAGDADDDSEDEHYEDAPDDSVRLILIRDVFMGWISCEKRLHSSVTKSCCVRAKAP